MSKDIKRWSSKMKRLIKQMPKGHWLFVADGRLYVMKYDENGNRIINKSNEDNTGMSRDAIVDVISGDGIEMDGGDW